MLLLDANMAAELSLMCASRFGGAMRSSSTEEAHSEAALLSVEQTLLVTGRLHRVLRPFVLRRLKETVAAELAPKVQHTLGLVLMLFLGSAYPRTRLPSCLSKNIPWRGRVAAHAINLHVNAAVRGRWSGS